VVAFGHPYVMPLPAEGEFVIPPDGVQPVPAGQRRVESGAVVQLRRRPQIGLGIRHGLGGQVDVGAVRVGRQKIQILGVVVMGVGQEDRVRPAALAQSRVEGAPQLGDVEEGLVVRP
jgi:hypothetical protein